MALAIPLLLILTAFVAYAMATLQHSQSTGLVGWLTGKLADLPIIGGLSVKQILKLDQWMTSLIGRHFKQVERYAVRWLSLLAQFTRSNSKAALSLGAPVWALAYWLVHIEIGRQAKAHDKPIAKTANEALAVATDARSRAVGHKAAPIIVKQGARVTKVERVVMPHAEEWDWINSHWGGIKRAVALASVGALAPTLPRVKPLAWPYGLTPTSIRRRLHRVERLLGVGAMAVAVAAVFRVSAECVTNGNIGRLMRFFCRSPKWLLDLLILGAVEAFIVTDLCEFTWLLRKAAKAEVPALMELVSVENALLNCHGDNSLIAFRLPDATPTPLQGVSPLAA